MNAREIISSDDSWRFPLTGSQLQKAARYAGIKEAIFGIRPEDIELSREVESSTVRAEVYVVEPLGDRTVVDMRLGSEFIKVKVAPDFTAASGDWLGMRFDSERFHVFDKLSGEVII
jgi:ABC-type sugar transport system ATPase subunit